MLFNSYIFVLFFLPAVIVGYFLLNRFKFHRAAMVYLLGMSLWFYGYFNFAYLFIILGSIAVNFAAYKLMGRFREKPAWKKTVAAAAIALNIGAILYFKYFDFFIENINAVFKTDFVLQNILLPLGISFFTFQQLSFVIDAYKGEIPDYDIIDYACFVTYFPQLVAGPIVTHDELVPQFADLSKKSFNWDNFNKGLYAFVLGLSKKVLIADVVGNAVNWGYSNIGELDGLSAILVTLAYSVQIYFDFSGYSDMAIGMGKMMNIDLPQNFDSPYKALTITDFWKRWHITLTRFFTKYIYIPLGGSRKGQYRTYLNMLIIYTISGIWHGANWTFIFWGICHGIFCVITRHFKTFFEKLHPALSWLITFGFVNLMWIFFRAESMGDAIQLLKTIAQFRISGIPEALIDATFTPEWDFLSSPIEFLDRNQVMVLLGYILLPLAAAVGTRNVTERMRTLKPNLLNSAVVSVLLVLCIISFAGISTFLYFNF